MIYSPYITIVIKNSPSSYYANGNNDVLNFVLENYEKSNNVNDFLCLKDFKSLYQQRK